MALQEKECRYTGDQSEEQTTARVLTPDNIDDVHLSGWFS